MGIGGGVGTGRNFRIIKYYYDIRIIMARYHVVISIKQFTEVPILLPDVDERISWLRTWNLWNNLNLGSLRLFQISFNEDLGSDFSYLALEEFPEADDPIKAVDEAITQADIKLGLLSLITDRGFSIIGSYVLPQNLESFSLAENIKKYRENMIPIKNKANEEMSAALKLKANNLIFGLRGFRISAGNDPEILEESAEVIPQAQELKRDKIERTLVVLFKKEVSNEWEKVLGNFRGKDDDAKKKLSRSLNLWMNSRMNRDIFSRFLIDWIALDGLLQSTNSHGTKKIKEMAKFIEPINGLSTVLEDVLHIIYQSRNDIAHSRTEYVTKLECFKKELMVLEWIFKNFVRKELGLNQLRGEAIPVNISEILSQTCSGRNSN